MNFITRRFNKKALKLFFYSITSSFKTYLSDYSFFWHYKNYSLNHISWFIFSGKVTDFILDHFYEKRLNKYMSLLIDRGFDSLVFLPI
jgi:hypothetical protein